MPEGWAWCRLGYICSLHDGEKIEKQLQYLDAKHFRGKGTTICNSGKYVAENSYLILVDGENSGEVFYTETAGFQGSTFKILNITNIIFNKYALYLIRKEQELLRNSKVGSAIPHLNKQLFKELLIPIPSFLEQKRLVSTIENAFNTIDELENNKIELSNVISKAKSKILDLAIHGKLVPQDTNDEPASILLEKLRSEKEEKIAKGELKRDKNDSYIYKGSDNCYYEKLDGKEICIDDEIPFEIPANWTWKRGKEIFLSMFTRTPEKTGTFKYIDIDAIDNKQHKITTPKTIEAKNAPSRASRGVESGDVLFSMVRPYLENIALIKEEHADCIASTGFYICRPNKAIYSEYLFYLMTSTYVIKGLNEFMKGDNSPSISGDEIAKWLYPIPPIEEQKRIVKIINDLFKSLDQIQANVI